MTTAKEVRRLLVQAEALAFAEVVKRARGLMEAHKHITGFCIGMGTACFYDKNGPMDYEIKKFRGFYKFLDEFNSELKLTGRPLKLTRKADGTIETVTDW